MDRLPITITDWVVLVTSLSVLAALLLRRLDLHWRNRPVPPPPPEVSHLYFYLHRPCSHRR